VVRMGNLITTTLGYVVLVAVLAAVAGTALAWTSLRDRVCDTNRRAWPRTEPRRCS
jgi:ABC-type Fe3+ transport system permease subunit